MSDNRHVRKKSGQSLPSSPQDAPWEHLSVENTSLASRYEKGTRLQSEIEDIDNAFSGTRSLGVTLDQQASTQWDQIPRYCGSTHPMSLSSSGAHNHHKRRYESSNSPQDLDLGYANESVTDAPYSSTVTTSHSSPGDMTESSSIVEANAPESPDPGTSDRDRNPSSRSNNVIRARPFSRKSKAGNQHTVTPSAAGPEGGFICKFLECGKVCGKTFKLPSDIRFHLIEDHMNFSPFQCERCMRVYTRKSLYTRHLKEMSLEGATKRIRQCPHREVEPDETFRIRKNTYEALWAIQLTQDQVDHAIEFITRHNNGALPSRRRRTSNINGPEMSEAPVVMTRELQVPQSTNHPFQQSVERSFPSQQQNLPSYGNPTSGAAYPSTLLRSSSAPDLFPMAREVSGYPTQMQGPATGSTEIRRRSPVPSFDSSQTFQGASSYASQQNPSSVPTTQPPEFQRYLEVTIETPLYPAPRIPGFYDQPHGFLEVVPTVDPHVLHQGSSHRHNSWDGSTVGSNYDDGEWAPTVRSQNYRPQITYESDSQGYKASYQFPASPQGEHIQSDSFSAAPNRRRSSFRLEFREEAPKGIRR